MFVADRVIRAVNLLIYGPFILFYGITSESIDHNQLSNYMSIHKNT